MAGVFLDSDDLHTLTGYCQRAKQISQLKIMGIPFRVNAAGFPVVARAILEGQKEQKQADTWEPKWAGNHR